MFSAHIKLFHIFDHLILLENSFSYENKLLKIIKNVLHCKKKKKKKNILKSANLTYLTSKNIFLRNDLNIDPQVLINLREIFHLYLCLYHGDF